MGKEVKKRYWWCVIYPESLPEDWMQIIADTGLPCALSPLHQYDVDEGTGELKKPHYHLILCWDGPATYSMAKRITDKLNAPIPKALDSLRGGYQYLTHRNYPEKYQYDAKDIVSINGFNLSDYADFTKSEIRKIRAEVQAMIKDNDIWEYADLCDYLLDSELIDHYDWVCSNTFFTCEYIKSNWRRSQKGIDKSTQ